MKRRWLLGSLLSLLLAPGCLPVITPPLRADVGGAKRFDAEPAFVRTSVGAHAASLVTSPDFPVDGGGGYVNYLRTRERGADGRTRREQVQGAYVEASTRVMGGEYWRVFAGGRGEALLPAGVGERTGYSALGRASAEFMVPLRFQPVAVASNKGAFLGLAYGMFGVGAYLEGGMQRLPTGPSTGVVGGGLTLRVPTAMGIFCCLWPKK
jgi:hypothetical protein